MSDCALFRDAFARCFVALFENDVWPDDPLQYVRDFFCATTRSEVDAAVAANVQLKEEIGRVRSEIEGRKASA